MGALQPASAGPCAGGSHARVSVACAAQEATRALVPLLGEYYARDTRNVFAAMFQDWVKTRYVSPDARGEGVLWYRSF